MIEWKRRCYDLTAVVGGVGDEVSLGLTVLVLKQKCIRMVATNRQTTSFGWVWLTQ